MNQIDWVSQPPEKPFKDIGNKRPSTAEEKAKLCIRLGNMVRKVPPAYKDWDHKETMHFKYNQEAGIKVVMKKNATVTELQCAINNMERFWK